MCRNTLFIHCVMLPVPASSSYSCAQCGRIHLLTGRDSIRCVQCGYRIMYKVRGKTMIHCVAR